MGPARRFALAIERADSGSVPVERSASGSHCRLTFDAGQVYQDHLEAQGRGRERWYEFYEMDVAEVVRSSHFERAR